MKRKEWRQTPDIRRVLQSYNGKDPEEVANVCKRRHKDAHIDIRVSRLVVLGSQIVIGE